MVSFTQDLKTLTKLTQFKSQVKEKKGSAKLPFSNLQGVNPSCWLYMIQNDFIFMQLFIFCLLIFLTS